MNTKTILMCALFAVFMAFIVASVDASPPANLKFQQLLRKARDIKPLRECKADEQCKWEVYNSETRLHEYDLHNDCKCDKCVKRSDDVSINAYVYRCQPGS
ncbi:uncharacterized protein LOC134838270 [Culicoides brevitarsis]|uniref:uncharacterized protein LOC134838270 n=1 Tax=Culicoides brevitarsis TaxID=469753 RepID=UPI00307BC352